MSLYNGTLYSRRTNENVLVREVASFHRETTSISKCPLIQRCMGLEESVSILKENFQCPHSVLALTCSDNVCGIFLRPYCWAQPGGGYS